ncbi:MAG: EAL domain-containing protein [Gammaproteobacteria bacterium]|nr:EAL domain-containing protein [Gammaproteobacteria bacterium]
MSIKSLGVRLALIISAVLFVLMLMAGLWVDRQLTRSIHEEDVAQAEVHARSLLASLRTLMLNGQGTLARDWLQRMRGEQGIVDVEILRRDGREAFTDLTTINAVNSFDQDRHFTRAASPPRQQALESSAQFRRALQGQTAFDSVGDGHLTVYLPIRMEQACEGCHGYERSGLRGVLKLSVLTLGADTGVHKMRRDLWLVAAGLTMIIGVMLWLVLGFSVLRPIQRLQAAIRRVGSGDRSARLPISNDDEFGELSLAFNRMQEQLRASGTRTRMLAHNVADAVIIFDDAGIIESVNPAVRRVFGYAADELVGHHAVQLIPEAYRAEAERYLLGFLRASRQVHGSGRREFVARRKDGTTFPMEIAVSSMKSGGQRHFTCVIRDITERRQQLKALEYQALHDALTGLPNRTLLSDRLQQAIHLAHRNSQRLVLMILDLDHFKEVNDTLGHHYGDAVLVKVAAAMREVVRSSDTVARLGGDEFAVLLPNSGLEHARRVANKLHAELAKPVEFDGHQFVMGASIGIAIFPQHGVDRSTLMRHADVAMYSAKKARGGFMVYDAEQDHHSLYNLSLMTTLRKAIDNNELALCYQPVIDTRSGRTTGVEALVRWQHPEHGLLYPDEFIPLAEQTGLIRVLTQWVLAQAIQQCQQWSAAGIELRVAVNLSVHNLHEDDLPQIIAAILQGKGLRAPQLRLEVTESAIMSRSSQALEVLTRLRNAGIHISIDDFGTGYSSLSYLRELPVDEVKIDKSFVIGMSRPGSDSTIVRAIIDLAHNMGLRVVAEGVESREMLDELHMLGCDAVQGFYISTPLAADELVAWLKQAAQTTRQPVLL